MPDADADGLSSGAIAWKTVERLGGTPSVLHPARGEHVHTSQLQSLIRARAPDLLVVLDMGSREGAIAPQVPTIVIDHHVPDGAPTGAVFVSGAGRRRQTSTSALVWQVCSGVADLRELEWLSAVGLAGDLGVGAAAGIRGFSRKSLSTAVALVNAANRSASREIGAAFEALLAASSPEDIASSRVPTAAALVNMREEVKREVSRCSRVAPRFAGRFALLLFASKARVHPLVATRWTGRLSTSIVIAANVGYLPGRVNFAMRSAQPLNLLEVLRGYDLPRGEEVAHGHPQATGGSLLLPDFIHLLRQMGFALTQTALSAAASS